MGGFDGGGFCAMLGLRGNERVLGATMTNEKLLKLGFVSAQDLQGAALGRIEFANDGVAHEGIETDQREGAEVSGQVIAQTLGLLGRGRQNLR